jgi:cysteine-S-conjugate beta-lyase
VKKDTYLVRAGRRSHKQGTVNPPLHRASTVLFPTVGELDRIMDLPPHSLTYGRYGTPITFALAEALSGLEGGHDTWLFPSGLSAITCACLAFLSSGDHLLMVDSVYGPTRRFCDEELSRYNIATSYYDPMLGAGIAGLIQPNTKVVFLESPGSLTFEVQDVAAIAGAAKAAGAVVLMDNTWATPLFFQPLAHGVDVSLTAMTKYLGGHSDLMMGSATATAEAWPALKEAASHLGLCTSPDDCFLALRGLRTLSVRLQRHQQNGLELARWLEGRPQVARVLHPALASCPGHEFWKRDFSGASGLFGVVLNPCSRQSLEAMLNGLELYGMGYSWGGYESLILPMDPARDRSATTWEAAGPLLRIHAGLEDAADLIADLEEGLNKLAAA